MEKIYRLNQEKHQNIQDHINMAGTTTAKRIDSWIASPPIGLALERLEQVMREGKDKNIFFIRSEDLTSTPEDAMKKVYDYLEMPVYNHNFDEVEQYTVEDDDVYGLTKSLHKIRKKVEPVKKDYLEVLGKESSDWINGRFAWYQKYFKYT
jgi:sulfotransferase